MTHKGYIRAKIDTWIRSIMYGPKTLDVNANVRKINLMARIRGQIITAPFCKASRNKLRVY